MGDAHRTRPEQAIETHLAATLFSGDRLFPVTVTSLSEQGFAAEGVALEGLDEEFLLEMTLPPVGEPAWSPKALASLQRSGPPPRVRVRARRSRLAPSERGTAAVAGLSARFEVMTEACRTSLRGWLTRLVQSTRPATAIGNRLPGGHV